MPNRPRHLLMLAPVKNLAQSSRIIHMTNAFCEVGTKVTLLTPPQDSDNAENLKRILHENAAAYVALARGQQILNVRLVTRVAEQEHLPEMGCYRVDSFFHDSATKEPEHRLSGLLSQVVKKMPVRLGDLLEQITDPDAAARHKYLRQLIPQPLYQKYKYLVRLYYYNYFFLIQALIIHKKIEPIDAIFCHDLWSLPVGCILKELLGIPLLYDSHEIGTSFLTDPVHKSIAVENETWMYKMCDSFSTVSDGCAEYYKKLCPSPEPLVITNAHRVAWNRPEDHKSIKERLSLPPTTPLAVYVGNLRPASHVHLIIKAIALCRSSLHLALVGYEEKPIEKLKLLSQDLGLLDKRVFFLEPVDYESLFATIYGADFGLNLNVQKHYNPGSAILPSKLFDYAQVGLPFLSDQGVEIQKILDRFNIGQTVDFQRPPEEMALILDDFCSRVLAGDFPADEFERAKESLVWPDNVVDLILSSHAEHVNA